MLEIAVTLAERHEVDLLSTGDPDLANLARYFGMPLERIGLRRYRDLPSSLARIADRVIAGAPEGNVYKKMFTCLHGPRITEDYDLFINGESGDFIENRAAHGVFVMFFPWNRPGAPARRTGIARSIYRFPYTRWKQFADREPWRSYDAVWCISEFSRRHTEEALGRHCDMLAPPIDDAFQPGAKEPLILVVGRLTPDDAKGHLRALSIFKRLVSPQLSGWRIACVGSVSGDPASQSHLDRVRAAAADLPATVLPNLPFPQLAALMGRARILWHLMGAGIDLDRDPIRSEHFGMPTVEAMASGAIPVGFNAGGQPELIGHEESGFLWDTEQQLAEYTVRIARDPALAERMSAAAVARSRQFSRPVFRETLHRLVDARLASPPRRDQRVG